ncbi:peptidyl-Lys metalloendopeptidase [Ramaria rubella]|nr:peptidyl-Lys metalloendopeptidase [Ramaria rubella]
MAPCIAVAFFALVASSRLVSANYLSLTVNGPESVDDVSDMVLTTTLTNTGSDAVELINDPRSALSSLQAEKFSAIHASGSTPVFTGMRLKYGLDHAAKNSNAKTTLHPGQSVTVTHSLASAYNFSTSGPGAYEISPSTLFHVVISGLPKPVYAYLANPHNVIISKTARLAVPRAVANSHIVKRQGGASFSACGSDQEADINNAIPNAVTYVDDSLSFLNDNPSSTPRFTTWFGSFTDENYNIILDHFTSLSGTGSFTSWSYDCACENADDDTFAYVFPDNYGEVFLCPQFFAAPLIGTNSKAGTLVHESTHFTATAGTKDFAYGQQDCESLAQSLPDKAIQNADSHEYFAENNPEL